MLEIGVFLGSDAARDGLAAPWGLQPVSHPTPQIRRFSMYDMFVLVALTIVLLVIVEKTAHIGW